ncbi:MAG: DNA gyrase C-terminal beta-propeller domain-containing protein, partial [Actinomycetes bacterium]
TASGVRGMRLRADDSVVGADSIAAASVLGEAGSDEDPEPLLPLRLLTITDAGYGKRTEIEEFTRQRRGGLGVRAHRMHAARGRVVTGFLVGEDDHLLMINDGGVVIRTKVSSISVQGRTASGVRVMNLDDDSKVAAVARVLTGPDSDEDEAVVDEGLVIGVETTPETESDQQAPS